MKIYSAMVSFDTNDGAIYKVDVIEYKDRFWLVPMWLESPALGYKTPSHIVQIDPLPHQKIIGSELSDFVISGPIPKAVFDGQQSAPGYIVEIHPDIRFDTPKGVH